MTEEYVFELGSYAGEPYFLLVKAVPSLNDPREFVVSVFYKTLDEKVEVARIDTSHGFTHFDRLFEKGLPKEEMDMGFYESWKHLRDNWRKYARKYDRNMDK